MAYETWRVWQLTVWTDGRTSIDHRQPGGKATRPTVVSSRSTGSSGPVPRDRPRSGFAKLLRCRRGMDRHSARPADPDRAWRRSFSGQHGGSGQHGAHSLIGLVDASLGQMLVLDRGGDRIDRPTDHLRVVRLLVGEQEQVIAGSERQDDGLRKSEGLVDRGRLQVVGDDGPGPAELAEIGRAAWREGVEAA